MNGKIYLTVSFLAPFFIGVFSPAVSADREPLKLYVHGDSSYAMLDDSGTVHGPLVDVFSCAMRVINVPYIIKTAPMIRASQLHKMGLIDMWYPLFDDGADWKEGRFVQYGDDVVIYWHIWPSRTDSPWSDSFKREARVTAFPSSAPSHYLENEGYNYVESTDDENALMLWFLEGRLDAILAPDFRDILKPGALKIAEKFRLEEYARYRRGFEVNPKYQKKYPDFKIRFADALALCEKEAKKESPVN